MHLSSQDGIKHNEQDRTAEKVLDLPARSPALRDEGRAKPFVDLTRALGSRFSVSGCNHLTLHRTGGQALDEVFL